MSASVESDARPRPHERFRGGAAAATASAATLTPAGLPAITLHSTAPGVAKGAQLRLALGKVRKTPS